MNSFLFSLIVIFFFSCRSGYYQKSEVPLNGTKKLCFIGDTGQDSPTQRIATDALLQEKCHGVYILGDVIYDSGLVDENDPQAEQKFFKYYRPLHLVDNKPIFHIVLGNHDYQGNPDAWTKIAKTNPMVFAPARYYFQEQSGICIAALDTNLSRAFFEYPRHLGQLVWLNDFNEKLKKRCPLKIALGHHPYHSSGKHGDADGTVRNFLNQEVIGSFDYYFAGHDHILSYEGNERGTELYISGAGGNPNKGQLPGFITFEIKSSPGGFIVTTVMKKVNKETGKTFVVKEDVRSFKTN